MEGEVAGASSCRPNPKRGHHGGNVDAIFDQHCKHVGWLHQDFVYDRGMQPRAYVRGTGLFTAGGGDHLGYYMDGVFRDRQGGAVAFLRGSNPGERPGLPPTPAPVVPPTAPVSPRTPPTPDEPGKPSGDWSHVSWEDFLNGLG